MTTDSAVDAAGRYGLRAGAGAAAWCLFDLHGSAAGLESGARSVTDAWRYDGWGQAVASTGSSTDPWRYRGALDLSPTASPLYAMGARYYAPSLGAFTQPDTAAGSAQDPLSLNRYLYAEADPATLVDPTGHMAERYVDDPYGHAYQSVAGASASVNSRLARMYRRDMAGDRRSEAITQWAAKRSADERAANAAEASGYEQARRAAHGRAAAAARRESGTDDTPPVGSDLPVGADLPMKEDFEHDFVAENDYWDLHTLVNASVTASGYFNRDAPFKVNFKDSELGYTIDAGGTSIDFGTGESSLASGPVSATYKDQSWKWGVNASYGDGGAVSHSTSVISAFSPDGGTPTMVYTSTVDFGKLGGPNFKVESQVTITTALTPRPLSGAVALVTTALGGLVWLVTQPPASCVIAEKC